MLPLPPVWVCARPGPRARAGAVSVRPAGPMCFAGPADSLVAAAAIALERGRPGRRAGSSRGPGGFDAPDPRCGHARGHRGEPVGRWPRGAPAARGPALGGLRLRRRGAAAAGPRRARSRASIRSPFAMLLAAPASNVAAADGERLCFLPWRSSGCAPGTARPRATRGPPTGSRASPGWLRIRAAAVTDDSASRARLYARVTDPLARERIGWSEAAARTGHRRSRRGRPALPAALGARTTALRLRLRLERATARREPWCGGSSRRSLPPAGVRREVRDAIALLDSVFAPLTPAEELEVGRAAATAGSQTRPRGVRAGARPAAFAGTGSALPTTVRLRHRAHPARPPRRCGAAVRAGAGAARSPPPPRTSAPARWSAIRPAGAGPARRSRACPDCIAGHDRRLVRALSPRRSRLGRPRRPARPGYYRQVAARYPSSRFAPTAPSAPP